ncbi:hypothetical protein RvY_15264 [Ramazzottius varieornatus]|uniref:Peptidase S1 domain-containing protein n=1 Tax=Ramazzottius varieornatus TaxID=947166 RepID=A0A1D1VXQ6_RAMVA|nr:hypothetical protein RvY_15264 [Ramazzottius varieornatus]
MKGLIASVVLVALVGLVASQRPSACGQPIVAPKDCSRSGGDRIVGGCQAEAHSWPWQCQLGKISTFFGTNYTQWICGCSILSTGHILTAAHCVSGSTNKPDLFMVKVGHHDVSRPSQYQKVHNVSRIAMHPDYNSRIIDNDAAVLVLREPLVFTTGVQPVCIPDANSNPNADVAPAVGQDHIVTGWGEQNANGRATAQQLQQVSVTAWNSATCNMTQHYGGKITNQMWCAGTTGKDSCQGDSGGPIFALEGGRYVQNGIVSWGYGCAAPNKPGVYAKVAAPAIRNFIQSVTGW